MNSKHKNTLKKIFTNPVPKNIEWKAIENLFIAVDVEIIEGNGSRVKFHKNGIIATFHRPHPAKEAKPYQIKDAKIFLTQLGITT